ncbi:hypothetical protein E2C01_027525 [Portunus trituberculatus]|uniref:Uncharacterized protein n=1 Tax=Portunus trituberculatus TaxID=210409 RepID=A0A5B7ELS1_PORTR|nr:hypothetical protein [Portunus trituberculatus]
MSHSCISAVPSPPDVWCGSVVWLDPLLETLSIGRHHGTDKAMLLDGWWMRSAAVVLCFIMH